MQVLHYPKIESALLMSRSRFVASLAEGLPERGVDAVSASGRCEHAIHKGDAGICMVVRDSRSTRLFHLSFSAQGRGCNCGCGRVAVGGAVPSGSLTPLQTVSGAMVADAGICTGSVRLANDSGGLSSFYWRRLPRSCVGFHGLHGDRWDSICLLTFIGHADSTHPVVPCLSCACSHNCACCARASRLAMLTGKMAIRKHGAGVFDDGDWHSQRGRHKKMSACT